MKEEYINDTHMYAHRHDNYIEPRDNILSWKSREVMNKSIIQQVTYNSKRLIVTSFYLCKAQEIHR